MNYCDKIKNKIIDSKIENPNDWMNPKDIASIILHTISLPKNIEISEMVINRKINNN